MKKFLALMLALVMVFALAACGGGSGNKGGNTGKIALVTDVGTIDDESFNQATWEGVKAYGDEHKVEYTYYQPAADSTADRMTSIGQAVKEGATVIVVPGYLFGEAMQQAPQQYPDVAFIAIDVGEGDLGGAAPAKNLYCAVFAEEQCGFLAGYGAVMDGYKELGFLGGMAVPAVQRYGSGFVQGASAAADKVGADVNIKYTYGGQFYGDANITAKMEGWYSAGTEIVFACGGGIYTSAVEAALNHNQMVIGVDVDQHYIGESADYAYNPFVTSAMKGLKQTTIDTLDLFFQGKFDTIGGKVDTLDLSRGDYVGLPTVESSWGFKSFSMDDYNAVKDAIKGGSQAVSKEPIENITGTLSSHVTLNIVE